MKLRTQLVIVFLLLAIVPLAGIVLFSYSSSQKAFRRAVQKETRALAAQMDTRVAGIRKDLGQRLERIGDLPIDTLVAASDSTAPSPDATAVLAAELGESAEFLDSLEWMPDRPFQDYVVHAEEFAEVTEVEPIHAAPAAPEPPVPPVPSAAQPPSPPGDSAMRTFVIEIPRIEVGTDGRPVMVGSETKTLVAPPGVDLKALEANVTLELEEAQKLAEQAARQYHRKREAMEQRAEREALRREISTVIRHKGTDFGVLKAQVREDAIVRKVLRGAAPESGDVAFAIDEDGSLITASDDEQHKLSGLDLEAVRTGRAPDGDSWVVATTPDEETGLVFGVARPVSESLRQMRTNAVHNFAWGLGLVALALFGIVPIANHLTRDIEQVMDGADRIGRGELDTPVEVRSTNEIGRLASAFNRMAADLRSHQEREIEQRLLAVEYERKSRELEEAREFQLSLLPAEPPSHPDLEIAVFVRTATEVGGDYYDHRMSPEGPLTLTIGDATGHGARAGTMVTVVKSLFAGRIDGCGLSEFLDEGNRTIREMGLERMAMALTVARLDARQLELASAGMPPALVYRASSGIVDELQCEAPPLGSLPYAYRSLRTDLAPGDVILMMTDGFPELENSSGEPLGYEALGELFRGSATQQPSRILEAFADEAERWTEGQPPSDDMTFVAIRVRS
jgi:serine phosphatase RsbU (regulator of sigma subunit)